MSQPKSAAVQAGPDPKRWLALIVVGVAQLMVVLDATIVNVALPTAMRDLGIAQADGQWVVTAYALPFGALLLLGGRIADYVGRKKILLIALGGFAAASALGGLAVNGAMLFAARGLQGVFAAMLAPAALSLLTVTFTETKERAKAFAVFGAIAGGGAAVGLLLGGLLTQGPGWEWCLLVNIPIAVATIFFAIPILKESKTTDTGHYDVPGAVLASLGLAALVWGFTRPAAHGWGSAQTIIWLGVAAVLLIAFVLVERRSTSPLLPMRILTNRNRGGAYLVGILVGAGLFAVFLFLTYYLQDVKEFSPIKTGLAFLPFSAGVIVGAGAGSALILKLGPKVIVTAGLALGIVGLLGLSTLDFESTYAGTILPSQVAIAVGMGFIFMSTTNIALVGISDNDAGVASAMVNTTQQIGGSLGTALLSTFAATAAATFATSHPPVDGTDSAIASATAAAAVHGYGVAFVWAAVFFGLAAIASITMITAKKSDLPTEVVHAGV